MMTKIIIFFALILPFFGICQFQNPNDCSEAVPGCSLPSFPIVPNAQANNPNSVVDFTSGSISNPSSNPQGFNSGCLLSGETSSTFITLNVIATGPLNWSIIGASGGCFDWIMWAMPNGSLSQGCAGINGNTLPPVACNWNGNCNGNTGMAPAGQLPSGGSASSYQNPINVIAGQTYLLCLSNYSGTSQTVNITTSPNVVCGASAPDQTICQGASANVTITTPGYASPTFNWLVTNGVSNVTGGTNVAVSPTVTTQYSVQVNQAPTPSSPGYTDTAYFTITVVPPPEPNAGIDDTVCLGQPILLNGTISVASNTHTWQYLTNGISPTPIVSFAPNANSLTPTVTVNQQGNYSFLLLQSNAICGTRKDTVNVFVSQITQTVEAVSPSCFGLSDGEIHITSLLAEEYSFDNGITWQIDSFAVGFPAGTYTVFSRNSDGCQVFSNVTITDPAEVAIFVSNDTLICENGTAEMVAGATGGASFLFHWDHVSDTDETQLVSPAINTTYTVYAENENGCISANEMIDVTIRNPLTGTITPDITICPGYASFLTADAVGGIGVPFTFTWSSGDIGNGANHTIAVNPPVTTEYTVTIEDECESTPIVLTTNVIVAPLPIPLISVDNDKKCEPATFVLTNETDPTMVNSVYWEFSDGQIYLDQSEIYTSEMSAGLYNIQIVVTSPQGCIDSTTFYNFLTVHPKPIADFNHNPNPVLMFNTQVQLTNYSVNGDTYEWFIESGNPSYSQLKHLQTVFPDGETGKYLVTLITTSEFGCVDTAMQTIIVLPEVILYAPNSFTPDDDEHNQSWGIYIEGIDIYNFELLIFNRWGEIIWESHDPSVKWDGTFNGRYVEQGTYTWIINTKDAINDGKYEFNGFINVLK
jgi:gliding motility-associated-like protein